MAGALTLSPMVWWPADRAWLVHTEIDAVMESLVQLCEPELHQLLQLRDHTLAAWHRADKLHDTELEVLSEIRIDLDAKLSGGG